MAAARFAVALASISTMVFSSQISWKLRDSECQIMFQDMDDDEDGQITLEECQEFMLRHDSTCDFDIDADETISYLEFVKGIKICGEEECQIMFQDMDDDEDGQITLEECQEFMLRHDLTCDFDIDADETISYEEFVKGIKIC